jgi:hypothetical protein
MQRSTDNQVRRRIEGPSVLACIEVISAIKTSCSKNVTSFEARKTYEKILRSPAV